MSHAPVSPAAGHPLSVSSPFAADGEHAPLLPSDTLRISVQTDNTKPEDVSHAATELRELLELAYPVVLTTALEFLPGFTSTIQAGHIPSPYTKEYVDAATLSTMFTNITGYSIGFGLASALDTLCSQAYGAKRFDKIGVYFQSGLIIVGTCLIPVAFLNWYAGEFLLLMGQDAGIAELSQVYSRYSMIGVPFVFLYELQRKALQAQGILSPLVAIAVLGCTVQITTGYWLAYYTSWGFSGVALSRSLGNISLPFFLWVYFKKNPETLYRWWTGWNIPAALAHVGLFLRLGIPGMLMLVMEWWAFEIMSLMAGLLPDPVVAMSAHSVVLSVVSLLYMFFNGFAVAANIRVGNHLGSNLPTRAKAVRKIAIEVALCMGVGLGLFAFVGRDWIPRLFLNDPIAVASASSVLIVWAPFEIAEGLNCVMQGIFRGSGMQDMAARTNMMSFYLFGMPLAYLLAFRAGWSVEGLWIGMGLSLTMSALLMFAVSNRWNWRALADAALTRTAE